MGVWGAQISYPIWLWVMVANEQVMLTLLLTAMVILLLMDVVMLVK